VRSSTIEALAAACEAHGPWNVVALAEPLSMLDAGMVRRLLASVPGTTGLVVVGPTARRSSGRIVALVEDVEHLQPVLRAARRLFEISGEPRFTLLLVAESEEEAHVMDDQVRLAIGSDEAVDIVRARIQPGAPGMVAELVRRLDAGFIVGRFGGLIVPAEGDLRPLAGALECPLFLIR
jgi:hypothetical protein